MSFDKTQGVIVITHDELRRVVRDEVTAALQAASPAPQSALSEWLDQDSAAKLLGQSRAYVGNHARLGTLRGVKVGRKWRFKRADIDAYMSGASVAR